MPAPVVDAATKEAVRAHAIVYGARPAARAFGLSEDRVCQWSKREGWFAPRPITTLSAPVPLTRQVVSTVIKPSEAALNAKQRKALRTHGYALNAAHDGLKVVAKVARAGARPSATPHEQERALRAGHDGKAWVSVAQGANVEGFERQQEQGHRTAINILVGDQPQRVEISANPTLPSSGDSCPSTDQS